MKDIRSLSKTELNTLFEEWGEPRYRANQVFDWLWNKHASSFDEMLNISKALREKLQANYSLKKVQIHTRTESKDGTIKYAFELPNGEFVEGVLIPTPARLTACISSQAGCSLACSFCATGLLDLKHNLTHYEIYDQVQLIREEAKSIYDRPLTNIVYMGMGEPLLNYRNVLNSISMVTSPEGLGMSPRRITVSTAGVAKMIKKLGDDEVKFEFALSLHSADDQKRSEIMSINDSNSIEALKEALIYFHEKTGTRVTLEYCIFKDVNDSIEDAKKLADFSRVVPTKINIIEYNNVPELGYVNTTRQRMDDFIAFLENKKVIVNVRRSRGKDIDGGCGQLALRHVK